MSLPRSFEIVPLSEVPRKSLFLEDSLFRPVVLVVDDEHLIADTRAAILTGWGYIPMIAYDAESALDMARAITPQILISDVLLTRMNGIDLAIKIKAQAPDCQIILFSGQADSLGLLATARNAGHSFTLLQKPVQPMDLYAQLSEFHAG
jgi:DNA-binding NtrC family response regulator